MCFDETDGVDGSVVNEPREGVDASGETRGDFFVRPLVDLDINDISSLSLNLAKPLRAFFLLLDIEESELDEYLGLAFGAIAPGSGEACVS